ncbi:hypothetical protein WNA58_001147 [Vibrio cholerae]|uniref:DUF91 domain-containing protein n=2 Tax=Vibrio TaxID=662 RepID=A0AAU8WQF9_9VIBR|nr:MULTISPECIES: hypothetical protein [Vibrio]EGR1092525.1 hypothetical protein [Vibrio cholerae]ASK55748.1 hypothetical protein CEQ48_13505 [Vibrio tarriae]EIK2267039.1 hypothetical protein [Vibrio cholerae]MBN8090389.1 hypothetical protein [Vibrio vulnificus]MBN8119248.1 hypothetical protein [Vibrio vulnificus]
MAIEQGIWKIGDKPQRLKPISMATEELLEKQILHDISLLNKDWLLIGHQVRTGFDKRIDLLALDSNGSTIVIELKRDKTPRDVVAQAMDYASWVVGLSPDDIEELYFSFAKSNGLTQSLEVAFNQKFGVGLADVELNESHHLVIVASELDASTERIINYLNEYSRLSINAVFFSAFEDMGNLYLSRAWFIDPDETKDLAISKQKKEQWNQEFYVSFGHDQYRHWEDARKYGFVAGGHGLWYSKTLSMLAEGDRIWVNIPKTGYVGVGIVTGEKVRLEHHQFEDFSGKTLPELETAGDYACCSSLSDDDAQYLVPVKWIKTLPQQSAFSEIGLFGNQNTVCKPRAAKWVHTVERLKETWSID